MTIQHDVVIELTRPQKAVIPVTQEDSTRQISLLLLNKGVPYNVSSDLASGETLLTFVEYRRADGSSGIYDTTSDDRAAVVAVSPASSGKWTVNLDGACFTVPGWAQINVRFMTESGKLLHSFPITVDVHDTACPDESGGDPTQIESIADMKAAISELFSASMSEEAKNALLNLLAHVAYVDEHGQDYLDDLEAELFRTADLVSISAVFEQGSAVIYDTDDLDTLRQFLTVTATYEDLSTREITAYTLSGTLAEGTSTITVSYGGKATTFDVVVTHSEVPAGFRRCEYIEGTGTQYISTDIAVGSSTIKIQCGYFKQSQAAAEEALVIGKIQNATSAGFEIGFNATENRLFAFSSSSAQIVDALVYGNVNDVECVFKPSSPYATLTLTHGETTLTGTKTSANNSNIANSVIRLFHTDGPAAVATARLYYCRVYRDSDIAVFDGVPCYRTSDNVAGLYDKVTEQFFSSIGSGQFVKGGDV